MKLTTFIALMALLAGPACLAETPNTGETGDREIEVGKHYQVVVAEVEGDEVTTTTYWAMAKQVHRSSITLGDGEWTQYTGPRVKPRGLVFLNRLALWIDPGRKSVGVGRVNPMGDETVVLRRNQITKISPMTETEFRERQEAHRPSYPRPPHARSESPG